MEPLLCNMCRKRISGDRVEEELRDKHTTSPVTLCPTLAPVPGSIQRELSRVEAEKPSQPIARSRLSQLNTSRDSRQWFGAK